MSNVKDEIKRSTAVPRALAALASIALIVAFFLPFVSTTVDYGQIARDTASAISLSVELGDLAGTDALSPSLFGLANLIITIGQLSPSSISFAYYLLLGFYCVPLLLGLLMLICSLARKPILAVIFDIPIAGFFWYCLYSMYTEYGFERLSEDLGGAAGIGVGFWVYCIASALLVVFALWMLVAKVAAKHRARNSASCGSPLAAQAESAS